MIPKERSKAMNKERRNRLIEISNKLDDLLDDLTGGADTDVILEDLR